MSLAISTAGYSSSPIQTQSPTAAVTMSEEPRMDGTSPTEIYDAPYPQMLPLTARSRVLSPCPIPHHSPQAFPTARRSRTHTLRSHPPPPPAHRPRNPPHHQARLPFKYPRSTSQGLAPYRKRRYRRRSIAACRMFRSRQIPVWGNTCPLPSQLLVPGGLDSPIMSQGGSEMCVLLSTVSLPLIDFEMSHQVSHSVLS